jgi:hypothetical protein
MPKMSRKDFVLIAEQVYHFRPSTQDTAAFTEWLRMVDMWVAKLKTTNPRFNAERFRTACGV